MTPPPQPPSWRVVWYTTAGQRDDEQQWRYTPRSRDALVRHLTRLLHDPTVSRIEVTTPASWDYDPDTGRYV